MTDKEALKQALEALTYIYTETTEDEDELIDKAITAIKEALAQPEQEPVATVQCIKGITIDPVTGNVGIGTPAQPAQQEPVAWRTFDGEGGYEYRTYDMNEDYAEKWNQRNPNHKGWVEPLYTTPPAAQRKPLTLDELKALWNSQADQMNQWDELGIDEIVAFAQDDHEIKENT